jgi:hypothetical protein
MKKLLLFSALFITYLTFAQVPQGISYQAIALNGSGAPVVSSNVRVKLSILDSSASGTVLYSESQLKTTNAQGLFNLTIGQGTLISGAFNTINWGLNTKFLKVEMDASGGTTYVPVGTTQLLSVPYALAADSLVTSAGEGITLVSPNGTPYTLSVNDAGLLSLPTTSSSVTAPNQFYTYGSFNSFNASTALLMGSDGFSFFGYKYLTSGTQLKFIPENNSSAAIYGLNGSYEVVQNGSAYTVPSNGFYSFVISIQEGFLAFNSTSMAPILQITDSSNAINATYSVATNKFSFTVTGVTTTSNNLFYIRYADNGQNYGDNLADGSLEYAGTPISFPGVTSTPKNFRVDLTINFNGSADYTITQVP